MKKLTKRQFQSALRRARRSCEEMPNWKEGQSTKSQEFERLSKTLIRLIRQMNKLKKEKGG